MSTVLFQIADSVRKRMEDRKRQVSLQDLTTKLGRARKPRDFTSELRGGVKVIAEVKFRSPSQSETGHTSSVENAVKIAGEYLENGARALSVLTEESYFNGHLSYLKAIRENYPESFLLMKDFVIDEYQLLEAVVNGADCVLLIVALLEPPVLKSLYGRAKGLGLSILVEVHNEEEMKVALSLGVALIGINNRNLKNLQISLDTSRQLVGLPAADVIKVCESGIERASEILEMKSLGFSGFLIGSSLMKTPYPGKTLRGLLAEVTSHGE